MIGTDPGMNDMIIQPFSWRIMWNGSKCLKVKCQTPGSIYDVNSFFKSLHVHVYTYQNDR